MEIKKILVSQPKPASDKSPYFDIEKKFNVEITFKSFIKIEGLSSQEFRKQKISVGNFTAIIFTSRTAVEHFFKLCQELRVAINEEWQYFCLTEHIANYLQNFITFRKRKVHFSKIGKLEDLTLVMKKHNAEKYLMPVADVHKEDLTIFTKSKVSVTTAVMFRTVSAKVTPAEIDEYDMIVLFTPAGILSLYENYPDYQQGDQCLGVFGIGTLKAAEERGLRLDCVAPTPEYPSMTAALIDFIYDNQHPK